MCIRDRVLGHRLLIALTTNQTIEIGNPQLLEDHCGEVRCYEVGLEALTARMAEGFDAGTMPAHCFACWLI
eukprot:3888361-Pyramimonas_sp.AAC.1